MRRLLAVACLALGACHGSGAVDSKAAQGSAAQLAAGPQPGDRLAPRDECGRLPGAADFRQHLIEAVQLRDGQAVAALADPAVKLDFGGGGGIDQLRQKLAADDEMWPSLAQLLALGCSADRQGDLVMPWLAGQDLGAIDVSASLLVAGQDVPILAAALSSAPVVTTISWDFVTAASGLDRKQPFTHVLLPLKHDGWVTTDKLRSPLDYRLLASRKSGAWRIEALVKGD